MDRDTFKKQLARNLKAARQEKGISLSQLERSSGIDISTLMHFEAQRRTPDAFNLARLAQALKTPLKNIIPNT